MRDLPLATILDVVAGRFGLAAAAVRTQASDEARQARRVFCYLARGLSRAEPVEIGETILERPAEVLAAADEIGAALDAGRDLAALVVEAEIELLALAGVAEARGYPLPTTASAKTTAMRIVVDGRDSFTAPHSDLVALAAAYLARLKAEPAPPPTTRELSPFMRAAKDYDLAVAAAREARFTARERGAVAARDRAFNALLTRLGVDHVEVAQV